MSAAVIAGGLGGRTKQSGRNYEAPCPVPSHGQGRGDRCHSLSLRDGDDGKLLVNCHAGCNAEDILVEIRKRGLAQNKLCPSARCASNADRRSLSDYARQLWQDARAIEGTLAERYLRRHRGLTIPLPPTLRFHPQVKIPRERRWLPALIAAASGDDHVVGAVQVTWLDPVTGAKANVEPPRRTFGPLNQAAVRLGPVRKSLGLAEGVETALSALELHGVTTWATLGAARFERVQMPAGVECVHIFGDADAAGEVKADVAARRLARDYRVQLHWPEEGKDFNDVLLAQRRAAA